MLSSLRRFILKFVKNKTDVLRYHRIQIKRWMHANNSHEYSITLDYWYFEYIHNPPDKSPYYLNCNIFNAIVLKVKSHVIPWQKYLYMISFELLMGLSEILKYDQ